MPPSSPAGNRSFGLDHGSGKGDKERSSNWRDNFGEIHKDWPKSDLGFVKRGNKLVKRYGGASEIGDHYNPEEIPTQPFQAEQFSLPLPEPVPLNSQKNPFRKDTWDIAAQMRLLAADPQLAARLKAAAGA